MKLMKKKGDESTIRKVWDDNKGKCYGLVGTIGDLLKAGILEYCDYNREFWAFLPIPGAGVEARFGDTRAAALAEVEEATE